MKYLQAIFLIAISFQLFAQQQIIQLSSENQRAHFEQEIKTDISSFVHIKTLSKELSIHLYEWEEENENDILEKLQQSPYVINLQANRTITSRNEPNDTLFAEQWQYINSGYQGTLDADIDALEAWNITTGGRTAIGDTIVVAVIDNGVLLQHPDWVDNLWTNKHEIPNNNIDDDNNGYIDDYFGWNIRENNDDVGNGGLGSWHGTAVAGIIGAKGNNNEGVTGINWNIKVMNLVKGSTDADVIEAYNYVLQMRKRYNETNGAEGAFVVVTNSSWGRDYGQPEDSPLWCMMYDELGEQGILSIGATSNASINVDEEGDLPTACKSDFLITVTNTNRYDEFEDAGYGQESIDLSAPGSATFTLNNNGYYGAFGGTSAAAPHVAGAVALLYSVPIEQFGYLAKSNPKMMATVVKDCILKGVDTLDALQGITATGGRLNLHKSIGELYFFHRANNIGINYNQFVIKVYPNPAKDFINIRSMIFEENELIISLHNAQWQLIDQQHYPKVEKGIYNHKIDVSHVYDGAYFLTITLGDYINFEKILIVR